MDWEEDLPHFWGVLFTADLAGEPGTESFKVQGQHKAHKFLGGTCQKVSLGLFLFLYLTGPALCE